MMLEANKLYESVKKPVAATKCELVRRLFESRLATIYLPAHTLQL